MIVLDTEALAFPWGGLAEKIFTDVDGIFAGLGRIHSKRESGGSHRLAKDVTAFPLLDSLSDVVLQHPDKRGGGPISTTRMLYIFQDL